MGAIIHFIFYQPLFNLLMVLYNLFGGNLGLAIVGIALVAKIITIPITKKQFKSAESMKEFQAEQTRIKKKYGKNSEKMQEELMKLSTKYMPAQLGGCLPLIISIILLLQIRAVVINLVNQGYHAFNEVAYVQTMEYEEDSIIFTPEYDLENGEHTLNYTISASNGNILEKEITFYKVDSEDEGKQKVKDRDKNMSKEEKETEKELEVQQRDTMIGLFVENFDKNQYFVINSKPNIQAYLRAPSDESISSVTVSLDEEDYTERSVITKGEPLNVEFFGVDMSRVGNEFIGEWMTFTPYFFLAVLLGITQYGISQIQMGVRKESMEKQGKKNKKEKKKREIEDVDFGSMMQQSSKQMIYIMPFFTIFLSLGYLGGANVFPSAVSLFWAAQNGLVLVQLGYEKRELLIDRFKQFRRNRLNQE